MDLTRGSGCPYGLKQERKTMKRFLVCLHLLQAYYASQWLNFFFGNLLLAPVKADLPVHCVEDEVVGTWDIFTRAGDDGAASCGHRVPNTALGNLDLLAHKHVDVGMGTNKNGNSFMTHTTNEDSLFTHAASVEVKPRGEVQLLQQQGVGARWTMVYDEGIEFRLPMSALANMTSSPSASSVDQAASSLASGSDAADELSLFSYFRYEPTTGVEIASKDMTDKDYYGEESDGSTPGFVSKCGRTFVGWASTPSASKHLCWYGVKQTADAEEAAQEHQRVVTLEPVARGGGAAAAPPTFGAQKRSFMFMRKSSKKALLQAQVALTAGLHEARVAAAAAYTRQDFTKRAWLRLVDRDHKHEDVQEPHSFLMSKKTVVHVPKSKSAVLIGTKSKDKFVVSDDRDPAYNGGEEESEQSEQGELEQVQQMTGAENIPYKKIDVVKSAEAASSVYKKDLEMTKAAEESTALQEATSDVDSKDEKDDDAYCSPKSTSHASVNAVKTEKHFPVGISLAQTKSKAKFVVDDDCDEAFGTRAERREQEQREREQQAPGEGESGAAEGEGDESAGAGLSLSKRSKIIRSFQDAKPFGHQVETETVESKSRSRSFQGKAFGHQVDLVLVEEKHQVQVHNTVKKKKMSTTAATTSANAAILGKPSFYPKVFAESRPRQQGSCGSCYAISTVYTLETRFRMRLEQDHGIKLPIVLAPQQVIACDMYNQGCNGGFPYLVGRHMKEVGLTAEPLFNYDGDWETGRPGGMHASVNKCLNRNVYDSSSFDGTDSSASFDDSALTTASALSLVERAAEASNADAKEHQNKLHDLMLQGLRFYAKDYGYVGGYYGGGSADKIKLEIYRRGPVAIAADVGDDMSDYSGRGVYFPPVGAAGDVANTAARTAEHEYFADGDHQHRLEWHFTTHAMAAVGWGEQAVNNGGGDSFENDQAANENSAPIFSFGSLLSSKQQNQATQARKNIKKNGSNTKHTRNKAIPYWVIRNSWGADWGDRGYMKFHRGADDGAVEFQAVWIEPDVERLARDIKALDLVSQAKAKGDMKRDNVALAAAAGADKFEGLQLLKGATSAQSA